jgi:hypothetical protein
VRVIGNVALSLLVTKKNLAVESGERTNSAGDPVHNNCATEHLNYEFGWLQGVGKLLTVESFWLRRPDLSHRQLSNALLTRQARPSNPSVGMAEHSVRAYQSSWRVTHALFLIG